MKVYTSDLYAVKNLIDIFSFVKKFVIIDDIILYVRYIRLFQHLF